MLWVFHSHTKARMRSIKDMMIDRTYRCIKFDQNYLIELPIIGNHVPLFGCFRFLQKNGWT